MFTAPPNKVQETEATGNWNPVHDVSRYIPQAQYSRLSFDRNFYRNLLFYSGIQWIRYENSTNQWRPINVPQWFPKHITNKFGISCDAMRSVFEQSRPNIVYGPAKAEEADIAASMAAEDIASVLKVEVDFERLRSEIAGWVAICGNAFAVSGYDFSDSAGVKQMNQYACVRCKIPMPPDQIASGCPQCGGFQFINAQDQRGMPMTQQYPRGKVFCDICGPFEIYFDMQAGHLENSHYVIRVKNYITDELKKMFPDFEDKLGPSSIGAKTGVFYQRAIAYINSNAGGTGNIVTPSGGDDGIPRTTLFHIWRKPCKELPYGGEAIVANEQPLWKGEVATKRDDGTPFVPAIHFKFNHVPGKIFAKTPADDMVAKQIQRNKVEALLQMGMERTSNPTWLLPTGIGIEKITGEPGEKIWYNGFLNGLKPERIAGQEMPGSAFRWMDNLDNDFEDLGATYDVVKGKTPEGVPTLGGTQMLLERGLARFRSALNNWGRGFVELHRQWLWIFKQYGMDDRISTIMGKNHQWESKKFSSSTISGNIDVRLEEGSVEPKSKAYHQMITGQMVQAQLVDLSDPLTRLKILQTFDAGHLAEGIDIDVKDAIKEREDFEQQGNVRFRPEIDNHIIHLAQHIKDAKSEEFFQWPDQAKAMWTAHIEQHKEKIKEAMAEQQAQDPAIARANIENQALAQKSQLTIEAMQKKKAIELEHKGLKAEMDLQKQEIEDVQRKHRAAQPT